MISLLTNSGDLVIAAGLIAIVLILLFLSRIGLVTKQSLPYVGGGLLALFGLFLWTRGRRNKAFAAAEALRVQLEKDQAAADEEGRGVRAGVAAFTEARAPLDDHVEALTKVMAMNEAKGEEAKARIMALHGEDLFARVDAAVARRQREGSQP